MIVWRDTCAAYGIREHHHCGLLQTADDGARLVAYNFFARTIGTSLRRMYYAHGPAGVTDWLGSADGAKAAYERMAKRRAR